MCKLTKNFPIQEVVGFSGFRVEVFTRGRGKFSGAGVETPIGAVLWDI